MVDGNKIIIIFYFIHCVCANYKCSIMAFMPSRGPDLENKVSCIQFNSNCKHETNNLNPETKQYFTHQENNYVNIRIHE